MKDNRYKDNAIYEFPSEVTILKYIGVLQERHAAFYAQKSLRSESSCLKDENDDIFSNLLQVCLFF